jgi:hypothetical protein
LISGAVKILTDTSEGLRIDNEISVGVGNVFTYLESDFSELRVLKYNCAVDKKTYSRQEVIYGG